MSIRITGIRLQGGEQHEHITHLRWAEDGTQNGGIDTRAQLVAWVDGGVQTYVNEGGRRVEVRVVTPPHGAKYLRTVADGYYTNNLLALPRV